MLTNVEVEFLLRYVMTLFTTEFRELTFDFFLHQVNMYPTRHNNILNLVLTTAPENVVNLSCVSAKTMDLSSDHSLTFFDILLNAKSIGFDKRTVFDLSRGLGMLLDFRKA